MSEKREVDEDDPMGTIAGYGSQDYSQDLTTNEKNVYDPTQLPVQIEDEVMSIVPVGEGEAIIHTTDEADDYCSKNDCDPKHHINVCLSTDDEKVKKKIHEMIKVIKVADDIHSLDLERSKIFEFLRSGNVIYKNLGNAVSFQGDFLELQQKINIKYYYFLKELFDIASKPPLKYNITPERVIKQKLSSKSASLLVPGWDAKSYLAWSTYAPRGNFDENISRLQKNIDISHIHNSDVYDNSLKIKEHPDLLRVMMQSDNNKWAFNDALESVHANKVFFNKLVTDGIRKTPMTIISILENNSELDLFVCNSVLLAPYRVVIHVNETSHSEEDASTFKLSLAMGGKISLMSAIQTSANLAVSWLDYGYHRKIIEELTSSDAIFKSMFDARKKIYDTKIYLTIGKKTIEKTELDDLFGLCSHSFKRDDLKNDDGSNKLMEIVNSELLFLRCLISIMVKKRSQSSKRSALTDKQNKLLILANDLERALRISAVELKAGLDLKSMTNIYRSALKYDICVSGDNIARYYMLSLEAICLFNDKLNSTFTQNQVPFCAGNLFCYVFAMACVLGRTEFVELLIKPGMKYTKFNESDVSKKLTQVTQIWDIINELIRSNPDESPDEFMDRTFTLIHNDHNKCVSDICTALNETYSNGATLKDLLFDTVNFLDAAINNWSHKYRLSIALFQLMLKYASEMLYFYKSLSPYDSSEGNPDGIGHDLDETKGKPVAASDFISTIITSTILDELNVIKKTYATYSDKLTAISDSLRAQRVNMHSLAEKIYDNVLKQCFLENSSDVSTHKPKVYDELLTGVYDPIIFAQRIREQLRTFKTQQETNDFFFKSGNDHFNYFLPLSNILPYPLNALCHFLTIFVCLIVDERSTKYENEILRKTDAAVFLQCGEYVCVGVLKHFVHLDTSSTALAKSNDAQTASMQTQSDRTATATLITVMEPLNLRTTMSRAVLAIDIVPKGVRVPPSSLVSENNPIDSGAGSGGVGIVCANIENYFPYFMFSRREFGPLILSETHEKIPLLIQKNSRHVNILPGGDQGSTVESSSSIRSPIEIVLNNNSNASAAIWSSLCDKLKIDILPQCVIRFGIILQKPLSKPMLNDLDDSDETIIESDDVFIFENINLIQPISLEILNSEAFKFFDYTKLKKNISEEIKLFLISYFNIDGEFFMNLKREIDAQKDPSVKKELMDNMDRIEHSLAYMIEKEFTLAMRGISRYRYDIWFEKPLKLLREPKKGGGVSIITQPRAITVGSSENEKGFEPSVEVAQKESLKIFEKPTPVEKIPLLVQSRVDEISNIDFKQIDNVYEITEKDESAKFDELTLENGDKIYFAQYGVYTLIDDEGQRVMFPIKTEEQLAEVQERFKSLHPDTHIGGKGRRANRDAIKPKKTKKRASTTPLKRVTKNKNKKNKDKNKNNNGNNKKSEKKKKNKKNHYNDRKKTRR